jgi:hypothetical protein
MNKSGWGIEMKAEIAEWPVNIKKNYRKISGFLPEKEIPSGTPSQGMRLHQLQGPGLPKS